MKKAKKPNYRDPSITPRNFPHICEMCQKVYFDLKTEQSKRRTSKKLRTKTQMCKPCRDEQYEQVEYRPAPSRKCRKCDEPTLNYFYCAYCWENTGNDYIGTQADDRKAGMKKNYQKIDERPNDTLHTRTKKQKDKDTGLYADDHMLDLSDFQPFQLSELNVE